MVLTQTIEEQLVEIYYKYEWWEKVHLGYDDAIKYHKERLDDGRIYCVVEDDKVLGYYERKFIGNECKLMNVFVMPGFDGGYVWKRLYKHFFRTMPVNIKYVTGEKQKVGGKWQKVLITKARSE